MESVKSYRRKYVVTHARPPKERTLTLDDGRELPTLRPSAVIRTTRAHKNRHERRASLRAAWAWEHDLTAAQEFSPVEIRMHTIFGTLPEDARRYR